MRHDPQTKQRSVWTEMAPMEVVPGIEARVFIRNVHDGQLRAFIDELPIGWHLSISHVRQTKRGVEPGRYPTWDEIVDARQFLLPADVGFSMALPVEDEYVAVHATTFHLHEHPERIEASDEFDLVRVGVTSLSQDYGIDMFDMREDYSELDGRTRLPLEGVALYAPAEQVDAAWQRIGPAPIDTPDNSD